MPQLHRGCGIVAAAALHPGPSFALLENFSNHEQDEDPAIVAHNARAREAQAERSVAVGSRG